tara:strand:+ start:650 stop:988 length:339 start_codon:yes stop_codon:yes gene_type:complete
MIKIKEDEWQNLYDNFETTWLLDSVKQIDSVRGHLGDDEDFRPPEIRTNLLKLHSMSLDVVNSGYMGEAKEFFTLAYELGDQIYDIIEHLESVQSVLTKLTSLYPESLMHEE